MQDYQNFTSLSADLERQFVPFERRTVESSKKAWTVALASAAAFGVLTLIIVFSFPPPAPKHADALDSDIPEETETPQTPEAAGEGGDAVEEEASEDEAGEAEGAEEEPADEGDEGDSAEAPEPPKGATKAPPTDLVGK